MVAAEIAFDTWDCVHVASVGLHLALCMCAWRAYLERPPTREPENESKLRQHYEQMSVDYVGEVVELS